MDIWVLGFLGVVVALLIAQALDERRHRLLTIQRLEVIEQRFREGGIDLADTMSTDVRFTEKWNDEDAPLDDRPIDREGWRE